MVSRTKSVAQTKRTPAARETGNRAHFVDAPSEDHRPWNSKKIVWYNNSLTQRGSRKLKLFGRDWHLLAFNSFRYSSYEVKVIKINPSGYDWVRSELILILNGVILFNLFPLSFAFSVTEFPFMCFVTNTIRIIVLITKIFQKPLSVCMNNAFSCIVPISWRNWVIAAFINTGLSSCAAVTPSPLI